MTAFVGRRRELAGLRAELVAGRNAIVTGPCGIGRTALVRHLARSMAREWRFVFVDGSRGGGQICRELFSALFTRGETSEGGRLPYQSVRYRIVTVPPQDPRRHVLVLDDMARVSTPKLDLVRWLVRAGRFRLLAVVEAFMPAADLARLRAAMLARSPLRLGPLRLREAEMFFEQSAAAHGLSWSSEWIHALAEISGGFPRGMRELLAREFDRRPAECDPRTELHESRKEATP